MKKRYYCSTWAAEFEFVIGESVTQLKKRYSGLESAFPTDKLPYIEGLTFETEEGTIVVWVKKKGDFSTLAHECVHAASKMLHFKGVKATWRNDEPLAYLVRALIASARS